MQKEDNNFAQKSVKHVMNVKSNHKKKNQYNEVKTGLGSSPYRGVFFSSRVNLGRPI